MDPALRHAVIQQLGKAMSDISEECYCAGWLGGTEYFVPELCRRAIASGRSQYWGFGRVTPTRAKELTALAEKAGCWADTDYMSVGYDPFVPFPIPAEYLDAIRREQTAGRKRRSMRKSR